MNGIAGDAPDRMMNMRACVIVLNWNGRADTVECLESLSRSRSHSRTELTVALVDNGSTDGTVAEVRERFEDVTIIENEANLGFAAGNNRGLAWAIDAGHDVIGVLNNDTVVEPDFLDPLLEAIALAPESTYASPLIRYLAEPDMIWFGGAEVDPATGIFVHRQMTQPDPGSRVPTPMVTGCALFAHRTLWARAGLFDERYFLIFEDADWSARANGIGGHGVVVNDSVIFHAVSSTIQASAASAADYYYARNGLAFVRDHAEHPWRDALAFVDRQARDGSRAFRERPSFSHLATPTLQARGVLDALRSRSGPMVPGPATRWAARSRPAPVPSSGRSHTAIGTLSPMTASRAPLGPGPTTTVRALAFYLPQFHPIAENDEWWGPGFTEWTNTANARRRYPGHYQPHVPADLGFYDLRVAETRVAQAALARAHGVEGFVYWHYWFAGRRLLERPFAEVLASGEPDLPFALAWANQTWSGIWHGAADRILVEQTYPGPDDDQAHFDHLLAAFTDDRYVTVDGRPLFYVFRPEQLPHPAGFVDRWQQMAQAAGLPGLYLVAEMSDLLGDGPIYPDPFAAGFDAGVHVRIPVQRSALAIARMRVLRKLGLPEIYRYARTPVKRPATSPARPVYPCVYPNWDNTPRSGRRGLVAHGSTPEQFAVHVDEAVASLQSFPADHRLLFVKSWNEWAEGNHLEPDLRDGHGYLEALARSTGAR